MSRSTSIILFDGVCNLCNGSVRFIIERDPRARFRFASLQSQAAAVLLARHGHDACGLKSIVLLEEGSVYERSTAALRIARHLSGAWRALFLLVLVPRPVRDVVYDWVGANRYRWFGKQESCMVPSRELRLRFLEGGT